MVRIQRLGPAAARLGEHLTARALLRELVGMAPQKKVEPRASRSAPQIKLVNYGTKRDFAKTAEPPSDSRVSPSDRPRYVIQKHAARRLHYDLRLELDGVFKSWAVTRGPSLDPADKRLAVEVEDHPLAYGDFEGTIPAGEYGGGTVQLWDRGYWSPEGSQTAEQALQNGDLKFALNGKRLRGSWVLVRMAHDRNGGKRSNWLLIKHRDEHARPGDADALLRIDRSVASGRSLQQIAAGANPAPKPFMLAPAARVAAIPSFVAPQLCSLVARPPSEPGWVHEAKFDGYRVQIRVVKRAAVIRTRSGLDWTERFRAVAQAAAQLPDCLLDGEIVALDAGGAPSFSALQAALSEHESQDLICFAFDLLFAGRHDLRKLPLAERKQRLEALLAAKVATHIRFVQHFDSRGDAVLQSACRMHLEGIVSKRLDAAYVSGRSRQWTKAKCRAGHEVVLGGWTSEAGTVRSLLAGVHRDGHLVFVGRIGTGFGQQVVRTLLPKLKKWTREKNPFGGDAPPPRERNVRWLKPTLVAEIEFAGWTGSGMIRQAAFKGLREDKAADTIIAESPEPATAKTDARPPPVARRARRVAVSPSASGTTVLGVTLTSPDKPLWPGGAVAKGDGPVTKLELAHYYEAIGAWMLPHIAGRPVSIVRAPSGIDGEHFFQRHATAGSSNLFELVKLRGEHAPYLEIGRIEALAALAQIAALEIHPGNCAPGDSEVAGRLVFDLDPAPDVTFAAVIAAALEVRDRLAALGLVSFCKTTGGKGLHVVTPLKAGKQGVAWPVAKNFSHVVCAQMAADSPGLYLDTMAKSQRTGRIFLDYLRNDRLSTAVAPLSPRARPGATVSMPIDWRAVRKGLDPQAFTVRTAPELLRRQKPWSDYDAAARPLPGAIRKLGARDAASGGVRHPRMPARPATSPARASLPRAPRAAVGPRSK
jgi:bifunctional non-homologous end joining protein LigD